LASIGGNNSVVLLVGGILQILNVALGCLEATHEARIYFIEGPLSIKQVELSLDFITADVAGKSILIKFRGVAQIDALLNMAPQMVQQFVIVH